MADDVAPAGDGVTLAGLRVDRLYLTDDHPRPTAAALAWLMALRGVSRRTITGKTGLLPGKLRAVLEGSDDLPAWALPAVADALGCLPDVLTRADDLPPVADPPVRPQPSRRRRQPTRPEAPPSWLVRLELDPTYARQLLASIGDADPDSPLGVLREMLTGSLEVTTAAHLRQRGVWRLMPDQG